MGDVVLHYRPGSADGLRVLLESTEKLLEPFPCRPPAVFAPWSPGAADRHLPIRPARPPPIITTTAIIPETQEPAQTQEESSGSGSVLRCLPHRTDTERPSSQMPPTIKDGVLTFDSRRRCHAVSQHLPENQLQTLRVGGVITDRRRRGARAETTPSEEPQTCKDEVSETWDQVHPGSEVTRRAPDKHPQRHKDGLAAPDSKVKRSWSVFTQRGVLQPSSQPPSKQFCHVVASQRLHLRQRAKWTICQDNCGPRTDIEQVWRALSRALSRAVQSCRLPTCNANVQRERAEISVFCDLAYSELVGRFLKEELQLSGRIELSVHKAGNVFSL